MLPPPSPQTVLYNPLSWMPLHTKRILSDAYTHINLCSGWCSFTSRLLSFIQTYSRFSSQNAVILAVRTRQTRSQTQPDRRAYTCSRRLYEYMNAPQERWPLMKDGKRTCREGDQRNSCHILAFYLSSPSNWIVWSPGSTGMTNAH